MPLQLKRSGFSQDSVLTLVGKILQPFPRAAPTQGPGAQDKRGTLCPTDPAKNVGALLAPLPPSSS